MYGNNEFSCNWSDEARKNYLQKHNQTLKFIK